MNRSTLLAILVSLVLTTSCDEDKLATFDYAETGFYGDNILYPDRTLLTNRENSLYCGVPKGQTLLIKITGKNSNMGGRNPDGSISLPSGVWYYDVATVNNWAISSFDKENFKQTFTSIDGGLTCDLKIMFDHGTFLIEYFENGAVQPTSSKTLTFGK